MLRILGRKTSANVQKVVWLLSEMEIAYERQDFGGEFGGNKSDELLRLNPNGVVPTLIEGETVVWESNTILRYIANKNGPSAFYPTEAVERADCERWMDWQLGTLNLCMTPLYVELIRKPPERRDNELLKRSVERARELFSVLDQALADRRFLAGQAITLADICTAIFVYRWFELNIERGRKTLRLERWFAEIAARPGFRQHVMIGLS
jgi:glutathione S-transferase